MARLALSFLLLVVAAARLTAQDFAAIDAHAAAAPPQVERALPELAAYLTQGTTSEVEKTRAVYRWVTARIAYDAQSFLTGRFRLRSTDDVLRDRLAVCEDYARLFEQLAREAGLEVVTIRGYAKGVGVQPGHLPPAPNHAWNAVRIDGEWRLLDATWGAGSLDGPTWTREFDPYFFLTPSTEMALSHYPLDPEWQLLPEPMSLSDWQRFPGPRPSLFQLGFSSDSVRSALEGAPNIALVEAFLPSTSQIRVLDAPLLLELAPGAQFSFRLESPDAERVVLARDDEWVDLKRAGQEFATTRALTPGRWVVMAQPRGKPDFEVVLGYLVRS